MSEKPYRQINSLIKKIENVQSSVDRKLYYEITPHIARLVQELLLVLPEKVPISDQVHLYEHKSPAGSQFGYDIQKFYIQEKFLLYSSRSVERGIENHAFIKPVLVKDFVDFIKTPDAAKKLIERIREIEKQYDIKLTGIIELSKFSPGMGGMIEKEAFEKKLFEEAYKRALAGGELECKERREEILKEERGEKLTKYT